VPPVNDTDRWAVPSYDFGGLLWEDDPNYVGAEMEAKAIAGIKSGPISRPLSEFIVILRGGSGRAIITRFSADHSDPADPRLNAEVYAKIPSFPHWAVEDRNFKATRFEAIDPALMAMWLLANRQVRYEMAADNPARQSVNAGRAKGGRQPLPSVRVIYLTKVEQIDPYSDRRPHQGGTHRSPIPHDRAPEGYSRTYKRTGITKWYPGPIKVKGGSEAAGAVRYEVRA
jgi:hypothetical protein